MHFHGHCPNHTLAAAICWAHMLWSFHFQPCWCTCISSVLPADSASAESWFPIQCNNLFLLIGVYNPLIFSVSSVCFSSYPEREACHAAIQHPVSILSLFNSFHAVTFHSGSILGTVWTVFCLEKKITRKGKSFNVPHSRVSLSSFCASHFKQKIWKPQPKWHGDTWTWWRLYDHSSPVLPAQCSKATDLALLWSFKFTLKNILWLLSALWVLRGLLSNCIRALGWWQNSHARNN